MAIFLDQYPKLKAALGIAGSAYSFYNVVKLQVYLNDHLDEQWRLEQQLKKINQYIKDYKNGLDI